MKSLQNVTKEATLYRGKEITHGIGYSSFMIEHNKLLKKYKRSHSRNSSIGFEITSVLRLMPPPLLGTRLTGGGGNGRFAHGASNGALLLYIFQVHLMR